MKKKQNLQNSNKKAFSHPKILQNSSFFKKQLAKNFSKQAFEYEKNATVQNYAAEYLARFLLENFLQNEERFFKKSKSSAIKIEQKNKVKFNKISPKIVKILDLGAGSGLFAKNFAKETRKIKDKQEIVPIFFEVDSAKNMLFAEKFLKSSCSEKTLQNSLEKATKDEFSKEFARNFQQNNQNIKIIADIENLPFDSKIFDIITSCFCIQWLGLETKNQFSDFFNKLAKIIKRNGLLAIAIPCDQSFSNFKNLSAFRFLNLPKIKEITEGARLSSLSEEGFFCETYWQKFPDIFSCLRWFKAIGAGIGNLATKKTSGKKSEIFSTQATKNDLDFSVGDSALADFENFSLRRKILTKLKQQNQEFPNQDFLLDWKISYLILRKK